MLSILSNIFSRAITDSSYCRRPSVIKLIIPFISRYFCGSARVGWHSASIPKPRVKDCTIIVLEGNKRLVVFLIEVRREGGIGSYIRQFFVTKNRWVTADRPSIPSPNIIGRRGCLCRRSTEPMRFCTITYGIVGIVSVDAPSYGNGLNLPTTGSTYIFIVIVFAIVICIKRLIITFLCRRSAYFPPIAVLIPNEVARTGSGIMVQVVCIRSFACQLNLLSRFSIRMVLRINKEATIFRPTLPYIIYIRPRLTGNCSC